MADDEKVQDVPALPGPSLSQRQRATMTQSLSFWRRRGLRSAPSRIASAPGGCMSRTASPGSRWRSFGRRADSGYGSGAGFPGLVLAVALPGAQVDLIESMGRKCAFIQRAIDTAGIPTRAWSAPAPRTGQPASTERPTSSNGPSRRPPLDPRGARLPPLSQQRRAGCVEGQTRLGRRGPVRRRPGASDASRANPRRGPPRRQPTPPPPHNPKARPHPRLSPPPSRSGQEATHG